MKDATNRFPGLLRFVVFVLFASAIWIAGVVRAAGQNAAQQKPEAAPAQLDASQPFRITTRMVLVDVVAHNKKEQLVTDLEATDFSLRENGKEQVISTFNFQHPGSSPAATQSAAALPPHVFRNSPRFQSGGALNVVLLDGLNSTLLEQAYVRSEMVKFVEKLPQGEPIAVYALGRKLLLLQDFTTDLTELKSVIEGYESQKSPVLANATVAVDTPMTLTGWAEQDAKTMDPIWVGQINAFAMDTASDQSDIRVQRTVAALTLLARTLAGYPGRKNLIWITEAIPMNIFSDNGEIVVQSQSDASGRPVRVMPNRARGPVDERTYATQLALVANLLADAQVAVYPVDARGLLVSPLYNVANQMGGQSVMGGEAMHAEGRFSEELFQAHSNMEDIADKTGGKAAFNRNDLDNAVREDMDDGSTYYSLGYYPDNKKWDGKFRTIQIASKRPGVKLRYRAGYFALDRAVYMRQHAHQQDMELGLALNPDSPIATSLQFEAGVYPPSPETMNRVVLNYSIDPHAVRFERGSDDMEHAELDCGVRVFAPGKVDTPIKSEATRVVASLKPEVYRKITQSFFPCQLKIDLPPGDYLLRLAVRDNQTGLLGSVNARLTVPSPPENTDKSTKERH